MKIPTLDEVLTYVENQYHEYEFKIVEHFGDQVISHSSKQIEVRIKVTESDKEWFENGFFISFSYKMKTGIIQGGGLPNKSFEEFKETMDEYVEYFDKKKLDQLRLF